VHRKEALKLTPNLAARNNISNALKMHNVDISKWWLEKKDPSMKQTTKVEVEMIDPTDEMGTDEKVALAAFRQARRKRIESMSDKMN